MGATVGGRGVTTVNAALCRAAEQRFVPLWLTTVFELGAAIRSPLLADGGSAFSGLIPEG